MLWSVVISIGILYIVANVVVYFWQERFLFKPEKLPDDFEYKYLDQKFKEHNIAMDSLAEMHQV